MKEEDILIGQIPLPPKAQVILSKMIKDLEEGHEFKNGSTSLFFHLASVISEHLKEGT